MTRWLGMIVIGALAFARPAGACSWFGTQLECDVGENRVTIGTQSAAEPTRAGSLPIQPLLGGAGLPGSRADSAAPLQMQLQNFAADRDLCRRIGNETYCY